MNSAGPVPVSGPLLLVANHISWLDIVVLHAAHHCRFVSKADVDRLTATRDAARARVNVARATLGELQARTARLNIYAPASGLVLTRNVEPGQTVGGGATPLFEIAQGGEMELLALVDEAQLSRLSAGNAAEVTPGGSDRKFPGQIWQVSPSIDPQTRQGTARVALSYAPELRPGGFASASINSGTIVAPLLPESAVLSDANGSYVYVVGADNKAVAKLRTELGETFVTLKLPLPLTICICLRIWACANQKREFISMF